MDTKNKQCNPLYRGLRDTQMNKFASLLIIPALSMSAMHDIKFVESGLGICSTVSTIIQVKEVNANDVEVRYFYKETPSGLAAVEYTERVLSAKEENTFPWDTAVKTCGRKCVLAITECSRAGTFYEFSPVM